MTQPILMKCACVFIHLGNSVVRGMRRRFCTSVLFINPRRACVTAVVSVCLSVCLSVCPLVGNSLFKRVFVLKTLSQTQRATKVKKFVGICLKRLRSRVMPRNLSEKANILIIRGQFSPLDTRRSVRGYPTIVNNIRPCPQRCLLMSLPHV